MVSPPGSIGESAVSLMISLHFDLFSRLQNTCLVERFR